MIGPRAVLLDALGTLVRLEEPWPLLRAELAERGVTITHEQARVALLAEMAYYRAHHDEAVDRPALERLRDRCAAVLGAKLPEPARSLPDLRDALLASLRFTPYPEVPAVLAQLRGRGTRLVVVSNWDVSLHDVLAAIGLDRLVDAVLTSAEVGAAKPDQQIFHRALAEAGDVGPREAVHIGDSLDADVQGARAAGIVAVHLVRDGAAASCGIPGVVTIPDLTGLLEAPVYRA